MSKILVLDKQNPEFPSKWLGEYFPNSCFKILQNKLLVWDLFDDFAACGFIFKERDEVENDERYLQPILYIVLQHVDKVLMYQRLKGDGRLNSKWSIGFGGHIEEQDFVDEYSLREMVESCIHRELVEETSCDFWVYSVIPHAIIYDDSNLVGRVHLGFVYFIDIGDEAMSNLQFEDSVGSPTWKASHDLQFVESDQVLETWSKLIIDAFYYKNI